MTKKMLKKILEGKNELKGLHHVEYYLSCGKYIYTMTC